jgi:hypothetical protein
MQERHSRRGLSSASRGTCQRTGPVATKTAVRSAIDFIFVFSV